jgi:hypothetical protein
MSAVNIMDRIQQEKTTIDIVLALGNIKVFSNCREPKVLVNYISYFLYQSNLVRSPTLLFTIARLLVCWLAEDWIIVYL